MEPVLQSDDPQAFARGVALLEEFNATSPALLGPNFGVAVAVLIHRRIPGSDGADGPPKLLARPDSGEPLSTGDIQTSICDATFAKYEPFLPRSADGPIYKPFTAHFKPRSPRTNNWRNSFDLQGGLGCDAPYTTEFLQSAEYLSEPRFDCPYREASTALCKSPAGLSGRDRHCFYPAKRIGSGPPGPESRAQHRPKLLTRDQRGYWYVEPTLDVVVDLLAAPDKRVPLYPFMAAVYGGSPYFDQWGDEITRSRFEADIQLDAERFLALFDPDPDSDLNARLLSGQSAVPEPAPGAAEPAPPPPLARPLSSPVPYQERPVGELRTRAESQADPARRTRLLERARQGHQRALEALAEALKRRGEFELSEQLDGYDLLAIQRDVGHLFEVKTWTPANLADQIRRGWAQLREYRYRNREQLPDTVRLYLVLDRPPPAESWAWEFLVKDCDVIPTWIEEGDLVTLPDYQDLLP